MRQAAHTAKQHIEMARERLDSGLRPPDVVMALAPLLTYREVADLLVVKPDTVRRWAASGQLPSVRLGGRLLRFRADDVEHWIEGQATSTTTKLPMRRRPGSVRSRS